MRLLRRQKKDSVQPAPGRRPASADITLSTFYGSLLSLESRIMFDGAAVATVSTVTTEPITKSQADTSVSADHTATADPAPDAPTGEAPAADGSQALFDALAAYDVSAARKEVVFISPSVLDYQQLLDGISPNVEVHILDPGRDGVQQMAEILAGRTGIDAIHLIGDGTEAEMHLGASFLTQDSISMTYAQQFQQIGQSLSQNADILIYGCNFGRGADGLLAMNTLATLTGADVAASTDRTGNVAENANWVLEASTGLIETSVVISASTEAAWDYALSTYTVTSTFDGVNAATTVGTLRYAITQANAIAGTDTINFNIAGAGVHTINLTSALPTITGQVTIDGTTEPGYSGSPLIQLDGAGTASGSGLVLGAGSSGSTISGLMITDFKNDGILINGSSNDVITENYIGTDGVANLGNANAGIDLTTGAAGNQIGGTVAGAGNVIAFNGWGGVSLEATAASGNSILGNSIYGNTGLGIDLNNDGVTLNDVGDPDSGPNDLKNFPVLTSANVVSSTQIAISGTYNSIASTTYRIEFFSNATGDPTGFGEGQTYLGFINVTTDLSGNATFSTTLNAAVVTGQAISATSTDLSSNATSEFAQNVIVTNVAPTLDASKSPALTTINEDPGAPVGAVGTLVSSLVDYKVPAGQVDNVTDPNQNALLGIAVTAADTTNGSWFYTTDNGASWNALGAVANTSAQLLAADANTRLYFQPNANYNGTLATAITFRAWDQTTGVNGALADTSTNGGTTAFSTQTDTASLVVTAVNDAPVASGSATLGAIAEDTAAPVGATVTALFSGTFSDAVDQVTGGSSANTFAGIAISNYTVDATKGAWQYSTNGGTSWTALPSAGTTTAVTLNAANMLRFVPAANYNGAATALSANLIESGQVITSGAIVNLTGATGGTTHISAATVALGETITPVNDAPTATNLSAAETYTEDTALNLINIVVSDVDGPTVTETATLTLSNTAAGSLSTATSGAVTSTYNAVTGVWSASGSLADVNILLAGVTFNPALNFNSNFTIGTSVSDGVAPAITGSKAMTGTAVNDAPVNTLPASFMASASAPIPLSGLSIADVDALSGTITTTLSVSSGTLSATSGGSVTVTGSGTSSIMLSGTLANVNAFLASTAPTFATATSGSVTLTMLTNDGGNTGSGGALTDTDLSTIQVDVAPIVDLNAGPTTVTTGPSVSTSTSTTNLVTNGNFGTVAAATPPAPWVESGTVGNGAVVLGAALDGRYDFTASNVTLTQPLTIPSNTSNTTVTTTNTATATTVVTTTVVTTDAITSLAFGMAWQNADTSSPNDNRLVVSYNGVTYATFQTFQAGTLNAAGLVGNWTYSNGATGPATTLSVTDEVLGALTSITINLPAGVTASGSLAFFYTNGATGAGSDDLAIDNVVVNSTKTTTTTVTTVTTTADTANDNWTATYTENGAAVSIASPASSIFDGDSANMVSAAIALTNPATGDRLLVNGLATASGTLASGIAWTRTDTAVTLSGSFTKAQYAAAIDLVQFENTTDTPSTTPRTITVTVNDGTFNSNMAIATINVIAVDDAPVATITPLTYAATEQVALTLKNTGLSISDVDAGAGSMTVTLSVTEGTLTVAAGGSGAVVTNSGTSAVTITGTVTQINNLLSSDATSTVSYLDNTDTPSASATLTLAVNDNGNTGVGGPLTNSDTATINITAVDDAPVNTVPVAQTVAEDTPLVFSVGTGNLIAISDVDAGGSPVQVTLTGTNGTVTLAGTAGLTFTVGTGTGDATMTFTGTIANINAALAGLSFAPGLNFNGAASLQIVTNDLGNTGAGGPLSATDTVAITVTPVDDAPVATITPLTYAATEQVALTLKNTGLSISDVDAGAGSMTVTLSVTEGTLTVAAGGSGAVVTNSGTSAVTITGTVTQINNLLSSDATSTVSYLDNTDTPSASATLTLAVNDNGNTGVGGPLTNSDTATINITAVDDAPVATITPLTYAATEQVALTLKNTGLSISDVDAGAGSMTVTLSVTEGTLTVAAGGSGAVVTNSGTSAVTITGTVTQINNLLSSDATSTVSYLDNTDTPSASATLTLAVNDNGNTGVGGPLTNSDTATINITAVDDAPVATITPLTYAATEQVALTLKNTGLSISDVDAGAGSMTVTLSVTEGTLTVAAGGSGAVVTNSGTSAVTITGTVTQINNLLSSDATSTVSYLDNTDTPSASATLTLAVNDNGNTGVGGPLTNSDTATINITAVDDAPVATITPLTYAATEQVALTLKNTGLSISDVDAGAGSMTVTLSVTEGTLTVAAGGSGAVVTNSGTSAVTITGTVTQINNLLSSDATSTVSYLDNTDTPSASATLTLAVNDNGNTGVGGPLTNSDTATINITAVDDAPVNTVPVAQTVAEDTPLVFSAGTGNLIAISDVDAGGSPVQVTLTGTNGTVTLAGTAGLTFTVGTGTGDATMTFTGMIANINAALNGLSFAPGANFNGAASLQIVTNDQGNTGAGGPLSATDTVAITVTPVDDAPVATITPLTYAATEQVALTLKNTGLSISDVDAGAGSMTVTLSVTEGTLTVAAGGSGAVVTNSGTSAVTITGTVTQINNLLSSDATSTVSYLDNTDTPSASATLTLAVNDNGNTGVGGPLTNSDTATINITAVDDAPVNTVPVAQTVAEDTPLVFSAGTGNLIAISDVDAGGSPVQVTLTGTNGTVTLAGTAGLTFTVGTGTGDATMTFTGTIANINAALNGLSFAPGANFNGAASLQIVTNDQGNTGAGGPLSATDTVAIAVTAVDDAPVNTVPVAQTVAEDTPLVFSVGTGNLIAISDVDAGGSPVQVTLTGTNGTVTLAGTAGLTFTVGTGTGDATMTFTGTIANINAALNGLSFAPGANFNGAASLQIVTNDQGNTGAGGPLSATDTVAIAVTPVDDAPVNTVPVAQTVAEDTPLVFSVGTGNLIAISDVDAGGSPVQVTLTGTNGTVTLAGTAGLTFTVGTGTGDATMTFTGTIANINAALNGLSFAPGANFNGAASLQIVTNDQGNTGAGGPLSATDTVAIAVTAVDDAPVATITPLTYAATEQVALTLKNTGLSISDVDAGAGSMTVTLSVTEGTLTVAAGGSGAVVTNSGTSAVTITGTVTQINNLLSSDATSTVSYLDNTDTPSASATLTLAVNDNGNTGVGGPLTNSDTATINITAVDDAPVATITPLTYAATEQVALTLKNTGLSISDVDAGAGSMTVTLSVTEGTLTVAAGGSGAVVTNSGTSAVTITGTVTQINNLLSSDATSTVSYLDNTDTPSASATLTLAVNDNGNTGVGGPLTNSDTATINITAVDDAPVNTVPVAQTVAEDTPLVFSVGTGNLIAISDVDAGGSPVQVTLTGTNGTVTLAGTAGLTFTVGTGTGDATMTFTGTIANINAALNGLSFAPGANFNGAASLQIVTNDLGNTGAGGPLSVTDTVAIAVTPVDDAPVNTVPVAQTVAEDTPLVFSAGTGNLIAISDVDAGGSPVQVTLTGTNGTVTLAGTAGLTFTVGTGTGDATMTFTGTIANINAALNGLSFAPGANFNGAASLQIVTNDQGNTGAGGPLSATDTVAIAVTPVDDAPVNTVPVAQTVAEDTPLVFSVGTGNLIAISDVDAGGSPVQVTLTGTNGTVTLAGTAGLTFTVGTGTGDATMTFTGMIANINAALNGLSFAPGANFNGAASLQIVTNDQGNTGAGGPLSATDTVAIAVTAVDDAPVNTVPVAQTVAEDTPLVFSVGTGNLIAISDVDAGGSPVQVTLTGTNGTVTLAGTAGLTFTVGTGTGDATMTFTGTIANINAALNGLSFAPGANFNGAASLQIVTNDQGNTGAGGPLSATDTVAIAVTPVDDAPVNTVPVAQTVAEDTPLVFSVGTGNLIAISDVDAGGSPVQVTLTGTNGTVTLAGTAGLTFTVGTGTGDATMTFTGTIANINAALNGLSFAPGANFNGAASLQIVTNDQGNTGAGGPLSATDTVAIAVTAVDDAPVATITPLTYAATEQVALTLKNTGLSISDVDAGAGSMTVTLSVTEGTLTVAAGGSGAVVTNSGTSAVTITGTVTQINNLLSSDATSTVSYLDNTDTPSASATLTLAVNDNGNTGVGGPLTNSDTATINITAVDDAPVATITPLTYAATEQVALTLKNTGLSISDVDAGAGSMTVTLSVTEGTLTVAAGGSGAVVTNSGTSAVTITGTVTQINNLLSSDATSTVSYLDNTDTPSASATLTLAVNDNGNTGVGGPLTNSDTATINITAVDDAPVNTVPVAQTVAEDTPLVFSVGTGNLIAISDVDAGGSPVQVTLTGTNGTVTLAGTAGLTFTVGTGTGDATMTFTGTIANINAALNGLSFAPGANFNGAASLQIVTNDLGNTGAGGPLSVTDTVAIAVTPVDDAPVNTVPVAQTVAEDTPLVFSAGTGNLIAISDVDAGGSPVQVTLTGTNGTVTLAGTAGLTFTVGTGTGDATMTFTGTIANINAALNGLSFAPGANFNGAASLQIVTNDQGNTGAGGPLSATDTVAIAVTPVDDAPVNTVPVAQTVAEDTPLVFSVGTGNLIAISDVDAGGSPVQVTLTGTNGTVTLAGTAGLTFTVGTGTGDATMTFTGMIANINAALNGLSFAPGANFNGAASLQIVTNDQGNTGAGGPLSATDTVAIAVTAVDDAPVNTVPVAQTVAEDTPLVFSVGTGNLIAISDVDAGGSPVQVTLTGTNGTVTLAGTAGLTFTVGTGTGDATMTFTGMIANINAALNGLSFAPGANFNGAASLQIVTNDQGNTGAGGPLSATDTVAIAVTPVDDAPVNTVPVAQTVAEDTPLVFSVGTGNLIAISDVDAGGSPVQVTLTGTNGTVTLAGTAGLTFTVGTGTGDATMTFTGTIANINAALNGLSFAPGANFNGAASLQIVTNDQGNTGAGGPLSATDTVAIAVTAVDDAPVATITPLTYAATEQVALTLKNTGLSISDVDAGAGSMTVTLSVTEGTLTVAAGGSGAVVTNSGTSAVTITGTVTQINNLLSSDATSTVSYLDNTDTPSASATLTLAVNDNGNTGVGGPLTNSDTATINITAVDDAPVATITPLTYAATEQVALTLKNTGLSISDVDAGAGSMTVTLSVTEGTLTVAAGGSGAVVTNSGTSAVTITGTVTQINNLLSSDATSTVSYLDNTDTPSASATLTLAVNDNGNTGVGGPLTNSDTATINITAVDDAPVNTVPVAQTVAEDTPLVFSVGTGNLIAISDVDAGGSPVQVTLTGTNGTVTLAGTAGLTFTVGTGTGDATMTFTGTIANINAALNGLSFAPGANFNGAASLQIVTNDLGNTGAGGPLSATDTVAIAVTAVDDAPVNTVPVAQTVAEDTPLVFSVGTGNLIAISDVDAGGSPVQVTLTGTNGTVTLAGTAGLTFTVGTGTGDATMTFTGMIANINAALNGLSFAPGANFNGAASLQIVTNDLGNTGAGGPLSVTDTVAITVTPVDDAPVATITPLTYAATEQVALTLKNTGLSISDVDAGAGSMTVTLSVTEGTLTVAAGGSGAVVTNSGTSAVTITGTVTQINNLLSSDATSTVSYLDNTDTPSASATLTLAVNDNGNTGVGGPLTNSDTATINITAVDDAPVNTVPVAQTVAEDTPLVFSVGTGNLIAISDVDAGGSPVQVTLTGTNGTVTLAGTAGLTFTVGTGTGDATMTFTGTIANINAALNGLSFAPGANFNGAASLQIVTNDQGNTGAGGPLSVTDTVAITVTPVNDAPVATGSTTLAPIVEDAAAPTGATVTALFSGTFSDVTDGASANTFAGIAISSYTADATKGAWQYSTDGGTTWTALGTTTTTTAVTLTTADMLRFVPVANYNGAATALSANLIESGQVITSGATVDLTGATGGTTHISAATVALGETITAVNDAPVAAGSATLAAILEDTAAPAGATVTALFSGTFSDVTDQVAGGSSANTLAGIAISNYTVDGTKGAWQYSTDGGTTWTALGTTTTTTAVTLTTADMLRFVPVANYNGAATALSANLIESGQVITSGATVDLTGATGGTTHISAATVALGETITAVPVTLIFPIPVPAPAPAPAPAPVPGPSVQPVSPPPSTSVVTPVLAPPVPMSVQSGVYSDGAGGLVGADDSAKRVALASRTFARVEQPDVVLEEQSVLSLEPLSNPVKTMLAVGHKLAERLTRLADDLDRAVQEREHRAHLVGQAASFSVLALTAGFVAWLLHGGSLLASFLVSMPAWRRFDPLAVLGTTGQDRRKLDRKKREEDERETKQFRGIDRVLDKSAKPATRQEKGRVRRPKS